MSGTTASGSTGKAAGRRMLMAVIYADMVGYSRLIELDDTGTFERLRALRRSAIDPAVSEYGGEVVQTGGDSLLIAFASIDDAVRCALKMQQQVPEHDDQRDSDLAIQFRIGVNFGDVIADGTDLHGDTVNVAARLQAECPPGAVCVTRGVRDHMRHRLDIVFEGLGTLALKNISRPIEAFVLRSARKPANPSGLAGITLGAGAGSLRPLDPRAVVGAGNTTRFSRVSPKQRPSIAVLPFVEYDPEMKQSYFGDGLVDDIVSALAALPDLFVISRASTLRYREYPPDLQSISAELGIRYIVSGSVRRQAGRLRITAELADAETQAVIASYQVDGDAADIFRLQDMLAERVAQRVSPDIQSVELQRVRRKRPENFDAYDYLLRGLDLLYRFDLDEFDGARLMFERAVQLDQNYAAPYAFTALWHSIRIGQGWSSDRAADMARCEESASAAVLRDPNDVWALALSGHVRALLLRDFDSAFALFDRALRASPNSAFAWSRSSPAYSYVGETAEARRRAEEALRLSPFDPQIFFTHCALGLASYTEGDYTSAVSWGRRSYAENHLYTANLRFLAASLAANGQLEEARRIGAALRRLEPDFAVRRFIGTYAYRDERFRTKLEQHLLLAGLPE